MPQSELQHKPSCQKPSSAYKWSWADEALKNFWDAHRWAVPLVVVCPPPLRRCPATFAPPSGQEVSWEAWLQSAHYNVPCFVAPRRPSSNCQLSLSFRLMDAQLRAAYRASLRAHTAQSHHLLRHAGVIFFRGNYLRSHLILATLGRITLQRPGLLAVIATNERQMTAARSDPRLLSE